MEKVSKPIIHFLKKYGISTKNLPVSLVKEIFSSKEAKKENWDYMLTVGNLNYYNESLEEISVGDIVGTLCLSEKKLLIDFMSELYNDKSEYEKRCLQFLSMGIYDNIASISNSNNLIKLVQIGNNYYISQDGNHRAFYLLFSYYLEKEFYKNYPSELKEIDRKFKIKALVRKKSKYDVINKICYCMSKCWSSDLKIIFTSNEDKIGTLFYKDKEFDIPSEKEFVIYFIDYLSSLDKNSKTYKELLRTLTESGFAEEIINVYKSSSDIIDMVITNTGNSKKKTLK